MDGERECDRMTPSFIRRKELLLQSIKFPPLITLKISQPKIDSDIQAPGAPPRYEGCCPQALQRPASQVPLFLSQVTAWSPEPGGLSMLPPMTHPRISYLQTVHQRPSHNTAKLNWLALLCVSCNMTSVRMFRHWIFSS